VLRRVRERFRDLDRTLRLRLPSPWWRWVGAAARLPRLHRREVRLTLREEAIIERALAAGEGDGAGALAPPGTSERVIEIPWVVRRLPGGAERILDVGTTFAPLVYQRLLSRVPATELHTVDLVPTRLPFGIAHRADVRSLPFPSGHFDAVVCISTLEHIGLDNTRYIAGGAQPPDDEGDAATLSELARVLREDGIAFVTVPAGRAATFATQRQYSLERWRAVVERAGLEVDEQDVFVHVDASGWRRAERDEVAARTYAEGAPFAAAVICAALRRSRGAEHGDG